MIPGHFTIADARLWRALCALYGPPEATEYALAWRVDGEIRALAEVHQPAEERWSLPVRRIDRISAARAMDLMTGEP